MTCFNKMRLYLKCKLKNSIRKVLAKALVKQLACKKWKKFLSNVQSILYYNID